MNIFETKTSEEQLEDMVDRIGQGEDVQIFSGFDFDEEQTKQIEERHNDLIELEKSLLELNEIFNEMAVMVESQVRKISDFRQIRASLILPL